MFMKGTSLSEFILPGNVPVLLLGILLLGLALLF
jgi:hypothetical protein